MTDEAVIEKAAVDEEPNGDEKFIPDASEILDSLEEVTQRESILREMKEKKLYKGKDIIRSRREVRALKKII